MAAQSKLRLAEIVASLTLTTDLATGQPLEHGLRRTLLAIWLGAESGLDDDQLRDAYYVALLGSVGCVLDSAAMARFVGDDIAFRANMFEAGGDISRSQAAGIECPVLLLTGEHDPFCPPDLASGLASEIPRGEFVRVDEVGHDIHRARPVWLAETVTTWLQHRSSPAADPTRPHQSVQRT